MGSPGSAPASIEFAGGGSGDTVSFDGAIVQATADRAFPVGSRPEARIAGVAVRAKVERCALIAAGTPDPPRYALTLRLLDLRRADRDAIDRATKGSSEAASGPRGRSSPGIASAPTVCRTAA